MSGLWLTCSKQVGAQQIFSGNPPALGIPNDHKADLDASGEISETNSCLYMDIPADCSKETRCIWLQLIHLIPLRQAKHLSSAKEMVARHWNPGKNAKKLPWSRKSGVAVTAPVNEDVHSKSHLRVFAFNETETLGATRVSKKTSCSCSEVLWRRKQLTSWKDSSFSAVLHQGSDLTFIVVSNQSLLIQLFALYMETVWENMWKNTFCKGMSSPSCQVAIVSFFTFWRGRGVLLIFLDQFAKAFNCESTLATNNLQIIYILLVHLFIFLWWISYYNSIVCMLNHTTEQDHHSLGFVWRWSIVKANKPEHGQWRPYCKTQDVFFSATYSNADSEKPWFDSLLTLLDWRNSWPFVCHLTWLFPQQERHYFVHSWFSLAILAWFMWKNGCESSNFSQSSDLLKASIAWTCIWAICSWA